MAYIIPSGRFFIALSGALQQASLSAYNNVLFIKNDELFCGLHLLEGAYMSYLSYSTLYKTFLFRSDSGKLFKYEIFQNPVEHKILTCISSLDENVKETMNWVVSVPELILPVQGHHPEYADEEVRKHFNENYRQV